MDNIKFTPEELVEVLSALMEQRRTVVELTRHNTDENGWLEKIDRTIAKTRAMLGTVDRYHGEIQQSSYFDGILSVVYAWQANNTWLDRLNIQIRPVNGNPNKGGWEAICWHELPPKEAGTENGSTDENKAAG